MHWVKDTSGKQSAMLTFAIIGIVVMIISIFLSIFADTIIKLSDNISIHLQKPDASLVLALLGAAWTVLPTTGGQLFSLLPRRWQYSP